MNTEKFVRVTMLFKKNPNMSDEKFNEYWTHIHGPLCIDWMKKYGILKCTQKHINKDGMQYLATTLPTWPLSTFDAIEDFYVRELKDFTDAILDDFYQRTLLPDAGVFADAASIFLSVGDDYIIIDDGKVVEQHERDYHCA
ncbi:uncharacterized protein DFL_001410 [Arthrobotrys flagrans]|uniref:EthD domain-containing protein n=1 Tax=Arthrobotrys flagrans TaxID=97331 RepID=A0A437AH02_ARTFL|nr:hypothetical protein DFL_001410 [Arthrobotrys flagrans]